MKSRLILPFALLSLSAFAGTALASGTVSQPQRMPSKPSTGTSSDAYARGKQIYMDKIACDACPVAGGVQDKAGAMALVTRIDADEFALSKGDKRRVKAYLNNRFKSN
jgi:hypothetical protein